MDLAGHVVGPELLPSLYDTYGPVDGDRQFNTATAHLMGDVLITCPSDNFARAASKHTKVYYYRLTQEQKALTKWKAWSHLLGGFLFGKKHRITSVIGVAMAYWGVPHGMELFHIFDVKTHKEDKSVSSMKWEKRLSKYFMGYWGQFARAGDPNGAKGSVGLHNETLEFPTWPLYQDTNADETVLRMRDPPVAHSAKDDVEVDLQHRCGWWRKHPTAFRRAEKPWQLPLYKGLGKRCCCDDKGNCARSQKSSRCPNMTSRNEFGCWRI